MRSIDWRNYLNKLVFCYGCGRLALPQRGKATPRGWKMLYQPHPEGVAGLLVCSGDCHEVVRLAMMQGPITEPLCMPEPGSVVLPAEVKQAMLEEVRADLEAQNGRRPELVGAAHPEGEGDDEGEGSAEE